MTDEEMVREALAHYRILLQRCLHTFRAGEMPSRLRKKHRLWFASLHQAPVGERLSHDTVMAFRELNEVLYQTLQPGVNPEYLLPWMDLYPATIFQVYLKQPEIA